MLLGINAFVCITYIVHLLCTLMLHVHVHVHNSRLNASPRIIETVMNFIYIHCRQAELRIMNFSGRKSVAAMALPAATVSMSMLLSW